MDGAQCLPVSRRARWITRDILWMFDVSYHRGQLTSIFDPWEHECLPSTENPGTTLHEQNEETQKAPTGRFLQRKEFHDADD